MNHKLILLLTALAIGSASAYALPPSYYANESRLASGKWVKIKTTHEGIYQLSYDDLRQLGFQNPEKVQVYGYGGVALTATNSSFSTDFPDDIQPVATHHTSDGRILFFGQADAYIRTNSTTEYVKVERGVVIDLFKKVRNPYDTASYYFLSDCEGTAEIPALEPVADAGFEAAASHIHLDFIENEIQTPSSGGAVFHGNKFKMGSEVPYTFTIRNYRPEGDEYIGTFYYKFGVESESATTMGILLPSNLSDAYISDSNQADGDDDKFIKYTVGSGYKAFDYPDAPAGKTEEFTFTVSIPSKQATYCAEDFVMLRYPKANALDSEEPFLVMNFPETKRAFGQSVVFEGIPEGDLAVWCLDGPMPAAFPTSYADGNASIVLDGTNTSAIAFRPSMNFPSPEIVGDVPSQNIHGRSTPDMVIITVADQLPQARELAELHRRYQGMDVMVVCHDDIYNEFSSGTREAMAYRRMAKMFYDRDPHKFKHLMFLGPAYYDNRGVGSSEVIDRLMVYEQDDPSLCTSTLTSYAADAYFTMLNDNYVHSDIHMQRSDINIGRVSTINPGQAAAYVAKVKDRFENPLPPYVYNHVLLMGGAGDNTKHSKQANDVAYAIRYGRSPNVTSEPNPNMAISPFYTEVFSRENENIHYNSIIGALNRGVGLMAYIGHGSPTSIENWGISEVNSSKYTYAPFVMFASCDQFSFDHLSNGLVETMLITEQGGAMGGVAATRSVYIEQNPMTSIPVCVSYANAKVGDTFGDVFARSRNMAIDLYENEKERFPLKNTTFRNILAYACAGDPALPVGVPEYKAEITSISEDGTVMPFENAVFNGIITKDGAKVDFNGSVRIEVLDGLHEVQTVWHVKDESLSYKPNTVSFDNEVLAIAFGDVVNGEFSASTTIPVPAFPTGAYRVIVSAESEDGGAIGLYEDLIIGEFNADIYDDENFDAPVIKSFYADAPSFRPGDEVSASTMLYAVIDPSPSGLNTMTGNVNTRTRLVIDSSSPTNNLEGFLTRNGDGTMNLEVPLKNLSDGVHTIELCIANNVGKIDRKSIEVVATTRSLLPEISVAELPASSVATIDISETAESSRLLITDASGKTVFTKKNPTFPYRWNLKDSDGNDVSDGLYNVSVLVQNGRDYGSTPKANITVLR